MRYILLIYSNESEWEAKSPAEQAGVLREHGALDEELVRTGKYKTADALRDVPR